MRRALLGGLGLALGVFAPPAAGQDARAGRAAAPPQRAARLGAPTAVPDPTPADPEVTPAGLLRRQSLSLGAPSAVPAAPLPVTRVPAAGGLPVAAPPAAGAPPGVVEDRGSGALVVTPAYPGYPTVRPGVPSLVPSVAPEAVSVGPPGYVDCPPGAADCPTGAPAVGRVVGCGKWWASGEYLLWWTRSAEIPPLVTTSSPQFSGRLGVGDTRTLLGGSFGGLSHSGGRFAAGRWIGDGYCRAVEGRFFFVGQDTTSFAATTAGFPLLARPFNNVNPNTPFFGSSSQIVADSTQATGGIRADLEGDAWGAEANYRRFLFGNPTARVDALVGYRYLNVDERLTITENFTRIPGAAGTGFPAVSGTVTDQFRTENHFHGGQVGLIGEIRRGRWTMDGRVSVAFGNLSRTAEISGGQSLVLADGTPATAAGGLLAVPGANTGRFRDHVFAVVPEVGVNVGYNLTSRMRVFVGYNFLYLSNALRPGDAIDTGIDAARVPNFLVPPATPIAGTPRPAPQLRSSDYFIQGISFGLQYTW